MIETYEITVVDSNGYTIVKEIEEVDEYAALLRFDSNLKMDFNYYWDRDDYNVISVVRVD